MAKAAQVGSGTIRVGKGIDSRANRAVAGERKSSKDKVSGKASLVPVTPKSAKRDEKNSSGVVGNGKIAAASKNASGARSAVVKGATAKAANGVAKATFARASGRAFEVQPDYLSGQPVEVAGGVAKEIVIGVDENSPIVTIKKGRATDAYKRAEPIEVGGLVVSRLSAAMQAAPSLLVSKASAGKNLFEVHINGALVRAADGDGLRAFARGARGINEHARLYEASKLQNLINAAAVWQVASVLVAQKHLADINKQLTQIKGGIDKLSEYLNEERRSEIEGVYRYLVQIQRAIQGGELRESVQHALEIFEQKLLTIQSHLLVEFRSSLQKRERPDEWFGTGDRWAASKRLMEKLSALAQDMAMCLRARVAAWYVYSLYPGGEASKKSRQEEIIRDFESLYEMAGLARKVLAKDADEIKNSFWNKNETLKKRRRELMQLSQSVDDALTSAAGNAHRILVSVSRLLSENERPSRIYVEMEGEKIIGARLAA